jgi:nucleoside-diphosphate-sugar epimerase
VALERHPDEPGNVARTGGSIERARAVLGWEPKASLRDGLTRQLDWHRDMLRLHPGLGSVPPAP